MECAFKLKVELPLLHRVRVSWRRRRGAGTLLCVLLSVVVRPMRSWAHLPAIIGRSELPCARCLPTLPLADRAALCNTWNESTR